MNLGSFVQIPRRVFYEVQIIAAKSLKCPERDFFQEFKKKKTWKFYFLRSSRATNHNIDMLRIVT